MDGMPLVHLLVAPRPLRRQLLAAEDQLAATLERVADAEQLLVAISAQLADGREVRVPTERATWAADAPSCDGLAELWRPLTARQREYALGVACGLSNAAIARQLCVSRGTVANMLAAILAKLALSNRVELAVWVSAEPRRRAAIAERSRRGWSTAAGGWSSELS